uniref:Uncharacterized protein n=1 Tax=Salix viminalis TaxID=40686 RepID=A0A6N2N900_SALVM
MEYKDRGSSIKMTFCQPDPIQLDAKCQNPVGFSACYTRKGCSLLMKRHRIKATFLRSLLQSLCVVLLFSTLLLQISTLMEFSQILGCTEEYSGASGSESGWTNYIASPIKENDFDDDNADSKNKQGDCRKGSYGNDDGGGESDDSLTSDASSGPSHPEIPCRSNEGSVKTGPSKYATSKYSSKAKHQKQLKERDGSARIRVEKEVSVLSAASYVRSRTKNSTVKLDLSISLPFSRKVNFDYWKCKWRLLQPHVNFRNSNCVLQLRCTALITSSHGKGPSENPQANKPVV